MDDDPRAISDRSEESGVGPLHHSAPRPHSLAFRGLPYELRVKIILAAVPERPQPSKSRALLLVSREFHEVVSPHHWNASFP